MTNRVPQISGLSFSEQARNSTMDDSTHVCSTLQGNGQVLMLHRLAHCLQDVLDSCPSPVKGLWNCVASFGGWLVLSKRSETPQESEARDYRYVPTVGRSAQNDVSVFPSVCPATSQSPVESGALLLGSKSRRPSCPRLARGLPARIARLLRGHGSQLTPEPARENR